MSLTSFPGGASQPVTFFLRERERMRTYVARPKLIYHLVGGGGGGGGEGGGGEAALSLCVHCVSTPIQHEDFVDPRALAQVYFCSRVHPFTSLSGFVTDKVHYSTFSFRKSEFVFHLRFCLFVCG